MSLKNFVKNNSVTSPFYNFARDVKNLPHEIHSSIQRKYYKSVNQKYFESSAEILKQYKNRYAGERCFIIGNGPSLKAEDLDKIKNYISFASNRIYVIFDKTEWRPKFYVCQDYRMILLSASEISKVEAELKIIPMFEFCKRPDINNAIFTRMQNSEKFIKRHELPDFSDDITKCTYEGMTVTYANIQIAVYMGFKKIYLLGVDHSYSISRNIDGTITKNDNVQDYFSKDYKEGQQFSVKGGGVKSSAN